MNYKSLLFIFCFCFAALFVFSQEEKKITIEDTLKGSLTPQRVWWDVLQYDIDITPDFQHKSITGKNTITFKILDHKINQPMQIDLQSPMLIDSVKANNISLEFNKHTQNVWWLKFPESQVQNGSYKITIYYHGQPHEAIHPPWEGGWIWQTDSLGRIWSTVACESIGASVWYPCKDHWSDEPDNGARITVTVPDTLIVVANGKLQDSVKGIFPNTTSFSWVVQNPINSYNIVPYIGKYVHFSDTFNGEKGILPLNYRVLDYNYIKAKEHFKQVKKMLSALEYWFGPYPFYEDGYQIVEAPYLGMEHQSAIAYGNGFINGYRGNDLSGTGLGLEWDFIIIHESGHEWFGNNITAKDIADMWIHESFTNYSEVLFEEYHYGKEAANDYCYGIRKQILNDKPIIAHYNVNEEGSSDMYYKGANMLHSIRHAMDDDDKFRNMLRGLNKKFYHQTVTSQQIQDYINEYSGIDFSKTFQQYLTTTQIPKLEYKFSETGKMMEYRWTNCIKGFDMPVTIRNGRNVIKIAPTENMKSSKITSQQKKLLNPILLEKMYYISAASL